MIAVLWMPKSGLLMPVFCQYRAPSSANDGGAMRNLRFMHPKNVPFSMVVRASGKVMWVSPMQ